MAGYGDPLGGPTRSGSNILARRLGADAVNLPVLRDPRAGRARPAAREWLLPRARELFRGIYTSAGLDSCEVFAVCSALAGEGKTTVALGLGVTIAQDFPERPVVVVETNFQQPVLAEDFGATRGPGLAHCILQRQPIQIAYRPTYLDNLFLVPAGGPVSNPSRLLRSAELAWTIEEMRRRGDHVILDTPAVLASSDAVALTKLADGALFVVRAGVTPAPVVRQALAQLGPAEVLGIVLNATQSAIPGWVRRLFGAA